MALTFLLFLLHFYFWSSESQVTQMPSSQNIREGDPFTITCNFTAGYGSFFWYLQLPGSAPSLKVYITSNKDVPSGRFLAERLENGKQSLLHLSDSRLHDSGIYWCAAATR
ncbi:UNVERIFIED_CONTAM: hypothetical protein K2H54_044918 [Gekko kuhli]